MSMFLFRGKPIWAPGRGHNAVLEALGPLPASSIVASASQTLIDWDTVSDIVLEEGRLTHDLKQYVNFTPGVPYTIALQTGTLNDGVTLTNGVLTYDPNIAGELETGIVFRATTGSGAALSTVGVIPTAQSMTGDASGGSPTGSIASINTAGVMPTCSIAAQASSGGTTGAGYPETYTIPSYQEAVFSDMGDAASSAYATGGTYSHTFQLAAGHPLAGTQPGFYLKAGNAGVRWLNIGGDWIDANGEAQGSAPFHSATITDGGSGVQKSMEMDVLTLVRAWIAGTYPNRGFFLKSSGGASTIFWHSRFATTPSLRPTLTLTSTSLGTITVDCGRSLWLDSTSGNTTRSVAPHNVAMRTAAAASGQTHHSLLWFDLSAYNNPSDITAATLTMWSSNQTADQTVYAFRVSNSAEVANIGDQVLGLAASYDKDDGIEDHADVLFVQKFEDSGWRSLFSVPGVDQYSGATTLMTAADANGFTKLADTYNGLKVRFIPATEIQLGFEAHWSPWRIAAGQALKGKMSEPPEELYLRYYLMLGNDWDVLPDGGKFIGFDGRFRDFGGSITGLNGMGRGNSSSGADGFTGYSVRGNFDRKPTTGSPLENCRSFGNGDQYVPDQTDAFGSEFARWTNHYLAHQRKGVWICVEQHLKMNTVTAPLELPRHLTSIVDNGNNTATATFPSAQSGEHWVTGAIWSFGGGNTLAANAAFNKYGVPITVVNSTQCTYVINSAVAAASCTPQIGATRVNGVEQPVWLCACPGTGNFDGVLEGWVNGRLASRFDNLRWRHSRYVPDGSKIFGIDTAWFTVYHGGTAKPGTDSALYLANMIVASSYIGPLVGYP